MMYHHLNAHKYHNKIMASNSLNVQILVKVWRNQNSISEQTEEHITFGAHLEYFIFSPAIYKFKE
jgi:hypothetical protein